MTLMGISDTELLAIVDDLADGGGWATTLDVRLQLGENPEDPARSGVGPRLSWLRRYGWVDQHPDDAGAKSGGKRWRVNRVGQSLLDGRIDGRISDALKQMRPGARVEFIRMLGEGAATSGDSYRAAYRRQWSRSLAGRRR
jgi:hypothetical protein